MDNLLHVAHCIPDEYCRALQFVKQKCPEAVLAGGALRDLATGKDVKDIDIFVIARLGDSPELFGGEAVSNEEFEDYDGQGDIHYVEELEVPGVSLPVQIIHLYPDTLQDGNFLRRCVDRIDLGLCQIGTDGTQFYFTELYRSDIAHRTITVNPSNPEWNADATRRRISRLTGSGGGIVSDGKYIGWMVLA